MIKPGSHQRNMEDEVGAEWDALVDRVTKRYARQSGTGLGEPISPDFRRRVEHVLLAARTEGFDIKSPSKE